MPSLEQISELENALIDFIIQKNQENFSYDVFKKDYSFYCRDILQLMEKDFLHYLYVFLSDEGYTELAKVIYQGSDNIFIANLIEELNQIFPAPLISKFTENSLFHGPPYLPLLKIATDKNKRPSPRTILPVFKWLQPDINKKFMENLQLHFPNLAPNDIDRHVDKYISG